MGRQWYVFSGPPANVENLHLHTYVPSQCIHVPGARDIVDMKYRKGLSSAQDVVTNLSHLQEASLHVSTLRSSSDI